MRTVDLGLLYMRAAIGAMVLMHVIGNIQHYNEVIENYPSYSAFARGFFFYIAAAAESIGGVMIIIGWRIRAAAIVLALMCIGSIFIGYSTPIATSQMEMRALYVFIFIYLFITGGGIYSLDKIGQKSK